MKFFEKVGLMMFIAGCVSYVSVDSPTGGFLLMTFAFMFGGAILFIAGGSRSD